MSLLVKILAFCILVGCTSSVKKEGEVRLLLDWWPNPNHIPLYVGLSEGVFDKWGIDLTLIKMSEPPETIPYLLSRRADIALYYMPNVIKAFSKTDQIRVIGTLIDKPLNCFLYRTDSGIFGVNDFSGKVLGGSPEGLVEAYIRSLVDKHHIEFASIKKIQMDVISALVYKNVDIVTGAYWNIESEQLASLGVKTGYIPYSELDIPDYHELVFVSRKDVLDKFPDLQKRFQGALAESISLALAHPDKALQTYLAYNPDRKQNVLKWEGASWRKTLPLLATSQNPEKEVWVNFSKWMVANGLISSEIDVDLLLGGK